MAKTGYLRKDRKHVALADDNDEQVFRIHEMLHQRLALGRLGARNGSKGFLDMVQRQAVYRQPREL